MRLENSPLNLKYKASFPVSPDQRCSQYNKGRCFSVGVSTLYASSNANITAPKEDVVYSRAGGRHVGDVMLDHIRGECGLGLAC